MLPIRSISPYFLSALEKKQTPYTIDELTVPTTLFSTTEIWVCFQISVMACAEVQYCKYYYAKYAEIKLNNQSQSKLYHMNFKLCNM